MSDKLKANIAERLSLITELRKEGSALKRKEERCAQENYALKQQVGRLAKALKDLTDQVERFGEWDDGCFYYNRVAASELQTPLLNARAAFVPRPAGEDKP